MNYQQLLFSFNGRIRRLHYWLGALGVMVAFLVVMLILGMLVGGIGVMSRGNDGAAAGVGLVGMVIYLAAMVLWLWMALALQVKRWHDRDKSWTWIFITLIPVVGPIWALIEIGFLDGTQGPNRFGPSPKGIEAPAAAPAAAAGPAPAA